MKIAKLNVTFDYGTSKNCKGLGNPAPALAKALKADYIAKSLECFPKGYTIAVQVNGLVYVADIPHEMLHARLKVSKAGVLSAFCPLGRQQAIQLVTEGKMSYLCTAEKMAEIEGKTDGNRVEYLLKREQHCTFDHKKQWFSGNGECRNREVKFFNVDKASGSQARLTNTKQMETAFNLNYDEYKIGKDEYR